MGSKVIYHGQEDPAAGTTKVGGVSVARDKAANEVSGIGDIHGGGLSPDAVVKTTQDQTINGTKIFSTTPVIPTTTRYYKMAGAQFHPADEHQLFDIGNGGIRAGDNSPCTVRAGVNLPHGAIITSFKVAWSSNDAQDVSTCDLIRSPDDQSGSSVMATANSIPNGGNHYVEDTSIQTPTIDNETYNYLVQATIDPYDDYTELQLDAVLITYTITAPLP